MSKKGNKKISAKKYSEKSNNIITWVYEELIQI